MKTETFSFTNPTDKLPTQLCAVIFALLVSVVSLANKLASVYQLPFLVLFYRYLFAFLGNVIFRKVHLFSYSFHGKGRRSLLVINAFVYVTSQGLQIFGLMYAPSILFAIMFATVPIWAEILSFFILKERTGLKATLLVLVSLAALITMLLLGQKEKAGAVSLLGFILLLLSSIGEAFNNILIRFLRKEYTPMEINYCATGIALVICTLFLVFSCIRSEGMFSEMLQASSQPGFLLPSVYLGVGGTLGAGIFKGIILQRMSALKASAWSNVASALAIVFGVVLLRETLHGYQIICTVVIIGSVLGIQSMKTVSQKK